MTALISPSNMTSDTAPSPYVASASSIVNGSWPAFQAFDNEVSGNGWGSAGSGPEWLQIDLGSAQAIGSYSIDIPSGQGTSIAPQAFTLQGSPCRSTWTVLDTQTAQTGWVAGRARTYTLCTAGTYRYWRLTVATNNGGSYVMIAALSLYAPAGTTPQTISFPAITGLTLAATASSRLAVSYEITSGPATIARSTLTITGAGTVAVQATQAGNGTYAAATPVSQSLAV